MYYLCTVLFIIIQWKDTLQYSYLYSCGVSLFSSLYFPVHACENYLSIKIYFMCFLLVSLLMALIYYFYMVLEHKVSQVLQRWGAHPVSYPSLKKSLSTLQDFLLVLFCRMQRLSPRQYQRIQYGFKSSSTISFQLCWLESQDEHIIEEEMSLWSLHWHWVNLSLMKRILNGLVIVI